MGIVVVGAVYVDVKGFPEDVYLPTGRNAGTVEIVHGGVGRNVAEDIANIEMRPTFVSLVDDSAEGKAVREQLRRHKVNTDYLLSVPNGMGMWLAVFDEKGDLAGSISKRPDLSAMLTLLRLRGDEIFRNSDGLIVEMDIDKEIIKTAVSFAKKYNKPAYGVVANMSIASQRRDLLQKMDCFVCNEQEAGILFVDDFSDMEPEALADKLHDCIVSANIPSMVVTLGSRGSVYANMNGERGFYPAEKVKVRDTTGAGDAFCAGVSMGLCYGKSMRQAVEIGTRLAASVITVSENVCPRFRPRELGFEMDIEI